MIESVPLNNPPDFSKNELYINREISWLQFNERVLEEAEDTRNKPAERLKFIAIFSNNLDEFFMVRVSGLKELQAAGYVTPDISGLSPSVQLKRISLYTHKLVKRQYEHFQNSMLPLLARENIFFVKVQDLDDKQTEFITKYYTEIIMPVLTPLATDSSRPFPLLANKTLNIGVRLKKDKSEYISFVQVPSVLPRIIPIPESTRAQKFVFIEDIIINYISSLYTGYTVYSTGIFRISRNADLEIDEEDAHDLLIEIEKQIQRRNRGNPVRLEISKNFDGVLLNKLTDQLNLTLDDVYEVEGLLDLSCFVNAHKYIKFRSESVNESLPPCRSSDFNEDIFKDIKKKDILLHLPYQSFMPVINLLEAAATDPNVLAVKQTLYRVSGDSPVINLLMQAAKNGKQVTVLVELKARFDEENNILWARKLEQSGCHVIYGLPRLKIHGKLLLIVRKESDGIVRYIHMSTGNYNDKTAELYTDMGLFTAKCDFGIDASSLFNYLTGFTAPPQFKKMIVAPMELRRFILRCIDDEIENAKKGHNARIIGKMNSLVDAEIIAKLYEASCAGVEIDLIVRGICCLKSGIKGVSENIKVKSIVGRFLEHTRIYVFENNGDKKIYIGSPDLMPRNLDRRIEIIWPVEEPDLRNRILRILDIQLKDNHKSRYQKPDGSYTVAYDNIDNNYNSQYETYRYTKSNFDSTAFI